MKPLPTFNEDQWHLLLHFNTQTQSEQEHSTLKILAESYNDSPHDIWHYLNPLLDADLVERVERRHRTRPVYYRITEYGRCVVRYIAAKANFLKAESALREITGGAI
jgi:DNA-binding MarR family transcriptional regulator